MKDIIAVIKAKIVGLLAKIKGFFVKKEADAKAKLIDDIKKI